MNLKSVLENTASRYGNRDAIVYGDRRLTYSFINEEANRFASALTAKGIGKGDNVVLSLPNSPEFLIVFFGLMKIGAVALPFDYQYKLEEVRSLFGHSLPSAIVAENATLDLIGPCLEDFPSIGLVIEAGPERQDRYTEFEDFLASGSPDPIESVITPEDTAAIMYTSSASFHPRGVVLSHESFVKEAMWSARGYHQTEEDVMVMFSLPFFHVFGLVSGGLASVYAGSTIVIVPGTGLSINSFMATVERERGTMYLGVPFIYALAVDQARKTGIQNDLSSLRMCASAGAPLSVNTAIKFKELYGKEIYDCYGLTEAVSHVTCPDLDGENRLGTVGKPLPDWQIRMADADGNEVPTGSEGDILVKGPIMLGYYNDERSSNKVLKNGWLYTGDIGKKDEDGFIYITGRSRETIIVKGQNIYPCDPESAIIDHPGVEEVAVMGVPDAIRGEVVIAAIKRKEGATVAESEMRQLCLDRMAGYKVPRKFYYVDSMPHTSEDEIDRSALREQLSLPPIFPIP